MPSSRVAPIDATEQLRAQYDAALREKEAALREKDAALREKDEALRENAKLRGENEACRKQIEDLNQRESGVTALSGCGAPFAAPAEVGRRLPSSR